tara:strand:+ start:23764 stop:24051 length:288 start_codon:yes stop_codon:yes gene_type:complete
MTGPTYDLAALEAAPPAVKLHNQLQMASAGHTVEQVLAAGIMHLGSIVGFASATKADAESLIDTIRGDLLREVEREWDASRQVRATMNLAGGGQA